VSTRYEDTIGFSHGLFWAPEVMYPKAADHGIETLVSKWKGFGVALAKFDAWMSLPRFSNHP
jgi:hypothetical protein